MNNYTTHQILNLDVSVGEASRSSAHSIDKTIQFSSLMNKPIDINAVQLNNSYVAVNSCMDGKLVTGSLGSQNGKFFNPHGIQVQLNNMFFHICR